VEGEGTMTVRVMGSISSGGGSSRGVFSPELMACMCGVESSTTREVFSLRAGGVSMQRLFVVYVCTLTATRGQRSASRVEGATEEGRAKSHTP
jgi:hypothetical protein